MFKGFAAVLLIVIVGVGASAASANCRGEIEGPFPNQIGTIMLFSSRGGGAKPQAVPSDFWALTGKYDTSLARIYPVRFSDDAQEIVDSWDWADLALSPPIVTVLVDGEIDGEFLWLNVTKLLLRYSDIEEARKDYPNALKGKCPPLFRR